MVAAVHSTCYITRYKKNKVQTDRMIITKDTVIGMLMMLLTWYLNNGSVIKAVLIGTLYYVLVTRL